MPKIHNIGSQHFVQFIDFPVQWGWKLWVRGWTQEIEEPFRTSEPLILRLPFHKAFVLGKWTGRIDTEEEALIRATEWRLASYDDFRKEDGWEPPAYKADEPSSEDWGLGPSNVVGEFTISNWQDVDPLGEGQSPRTS